jgi:hypothetical protein
MNLSPVNQTRDSLIERPGRFLRLSKPSMASAIEVISGFLDSRRYCRLLSLSYTTPREAFGVEFFKTEDGSLHMGRIALMLMLLAMVGGCVMVGFDLLCVTRIALVAGGWLVLGDKRPERLWAGKVSNSVRVLAAALVAFSIVGQFYVLWAHHHAHV